MPHVMSTEKIRTDISFFLQYFTYKYPTYNLQTRLQFPPAGLERTLLSVLNYDISNSLAAPLDTILPLHHKIIRRFLPDQRSAFTGSPGGRPMLEKRKQKSQSAPPKEPPKHGGGAVEAAVLRRAVEDDTSARRDGQRVR